MTTPPTFDRKYLDLARLLRRRLNPLPDATSAGALSQMQTLMATLQLAELATQGQLDALTVDVTPRRVVQALPSISIGSTTQAITWSPALAGNYIVVPTVITSAGNLGLLLASLQAGSKTPTGCTIIVKNNALVSIGGASLEVMIHPAP